MLKNLLTLLKMEYIFTKRNLSVFVMGLAFPVVLYILFSGMQQFDNIEIQTRVYKEMLISMTAFSSISFGILQLPISIVNDEKNNWLNTINHSPIPVWQYYIARIIRIFIIFIIAIVIVFTVGHYVRDVNMTANEWFMSGLLLALGSSTFLGLGALFSLIKSSEKLTTLANIVYLGLAMLGGLWWPVYLFPEWLQNISKCTPTYHLLNLINKYLKENIYDLNSIAVLSGYAITCIMITLIIKKRIEVK